MNYCNVATLEKLAIIVSDMEKLLERTDGTEISESISEVLSISAEQLNRELYMTRKLNISDIGDNKEQVLDIRAQISILVPIWKLSIERRRGMKIDCEFWSIYEYFKYVDRDVIVNNTINLFESYPDEYTQQFTMLQQIYPFLTGTIDIKNRKYSLIEEYVDMMKKEVDNFRWLYAKLSDYKSKQLIIHIIKFWFTFDVTDLNALSENVYKDYFDLDLIKCDNKDVFVDCGAYIGDTIIDYMETYGDKYQKIYCYEISPEFIELAKQNLIGRQNIVFRRNGVGSENRTMFIDENSHKAGTRIASEGEVSVEIVKIDDDVEEPVTVIKMDIEGAEQDALKGAENHIKLEKPKLLISAYHRPADIFEIPRIIDCVRGDYNFYLRFYGKGLWPCDYIVYAI